LGPTAPASYRVFWGANQLGRNDFPDQPLDQKRARGVDLRL
jgi:hypothetical protein